MSLLGLRGRIGGAAVACGSLSVGLLAPLGLWGQPFGLGPYEPAHFYPGSSAIQGVFEESGGLRVNPVFAGWATRVVSFSPGAGLDFSQFPPFAYPPSNVLGPAMTPRQNDPFDVVPLGRGGQLTVAFARPIRNGPGFDFAVFENGFDAFFLELAWVEVSSDGENFFRFPNSSLTPNPVGAFQIPAIDPTRVSGLASKYAAGYGTPFDLASLPVEVESIRFVRLVDIVGDGNARDSAGRVIYDPYQTELTAGFDLDAVGVLHEALTVQMAHDEVTGWQLRWRGRAQALWSEKIGVEWFLRNEPLQYAVERHRADGTWEELAVVPGSNGEMVFALAAWASAERGIFRVREVAPPGSP